MNKVSLILPLLIFVSRYFFLNEINLKNEGMLKDNLTLSAKTDGLHSIN